MNLARGAGVQINSNGRAVVVGKRRVSVSRRGVLMSALFVLGAKGLGAQAPGYPSVPIGEMRAEYVAYVITEINDVLAEWGGHWGEDRIEDLVDMYWDDALFIAPDGTLRRGRDELRTYFTEALPRMGGIEAFMLDFDASGGMSQVFGNYMLTVEGVGTSGPMLTVYVQRGRGWRIRSQVFMPPG